MARRIVIPYKPREQMKPFHCSRCRWRCLVLHRRFGKTTGFVNHLQRQATLDPKIIADARGLKYTPLQLEEWRNMPRTFGYFGPYYSQAKSMAWDILKYYASFIPGVKINETELKVDYPGGGRVRIFGADNVQSFRGFKWWEVGFDEYSQIDPQLFDEIIAPGCLDVQAPATFMGTIIGKNHLWKMHDKHKNDPNWFTLYAKASESGVLDPEILEKERLRYIDEGKEAEFLQEFELEPMAAIKGSYLAKQMSDAHSTGRIGFVHHEDWLPVDTYWDLGWNDTMVVLFIQNKGFERRIIDCFYAHGASFPDVAKALKDKPYKYGTHFVPHDARQHDVATGAQRVTSLNNLLADPVVVLERPRSKEDKIEAARWLMPKVFIDSTKCEYLINCLENYRQDFDDKTGNWKNEPVHDWSSHAFDAFSYYALNVRNGGAEQTFNNDPQQEYHSLHQKSSSFSIKR